MIENRSYSKDKNRKEIRKQIIPIQISSSQVLSQNQSDTEEDTCRTHKWKAKTKSKPGKSKRRTAEGKVLSQEHRQSLAFTRNFIQKQKSKAKNQSWKFKAWNKETYLKTEKGKRTKRRFSIIIEIPTYKSIPLKGY